ncbi:MAG: PIN domain-containing protein [Clostridia bacterium]
MKTTFLVDFENVGEQGLNGSDKLAESDTIVIFYRGKISLASGVYQLFRSTRQGKNALDFEIVAHMGYLIGQDKNREIVIISKDKGYLSANDHLKELVKEVKIQTCVSIAEFYQPKSTISLPTKVAVTTSAKASQTPIIVKAPAIIAKPIVATVEPKPTLESLLANKCSKEEIIKIKIIFEKVNTNQELHNELTTIFGGGQKQIEVYNLIKALFKESKKNL